ncbi:MAG: CDP-alcohol phosphatidyltransferase, partial [Fidelibacterota bacterium]
MDEEKKAVRVIDTFTGSWEKRHLPQMAQALPQRITPDHLTVLGILASLIIAAGYVLTWYSP